MAEAVDAAAATEEFDVRVDHLLQRSCEVARALAGAHQAAMAMIVAGDWAQARKYFSLSDKYEQWKDFTMPGRGIGLHAVVVAENEALRLTQDELEQHPDWRGFAESADKHPPLRGLLAVPIVGEDGLNYELLQVSDKVDGGDFDEEDEAGCSALPTRRRSASMRFARFGHCGSLSLPRPRPSKRRRRSSSSSPPDFVRPRAPVEPCRDRNRVQPSDRERLRRGSRGRVAAAG